MKTLPVFALIVLSVICGNFSPVNAQVIDTETPWIDLGQVTSIGPFGEIGPGSYDAFGQTFVTPSGFNHLNSFSWSLYRADVYGPDNTTFAAYVAEWDPVALTIKGDFLFESGPRVLAEPDHVWKRFTFQNVGLLLDPAHQYIVFLSGQPFFDGHIGAANVAATTYELPGDTYLSGKAYLGTNFKTLATDSWIRPGSDGGKFGVTDFAITARFSEFRPVPEPSTYGLAAVVVLAGAILGRRRARG